MEYYIIVKFMTLYIKELSSECFKRIVFNVNEEAAITD